MFLSFSTISIFFYFYLIFKRCHLYYIFSTMYPRIALNFWPSCLHFLRVRVTGVYCHAWFMLGINLRSSCVLGTFSIGWGHISSPRFYSFILKFIRALFFLFHFLKKCHSQAFSLVRFYNIVHVCCVLRLSRKNSHVSLAPMTWLKSRWAATLSGSLTCFSALTLLLQGWLPQARQSLCLDLCSIHFPGITCSRPSLFCSCCSCLPAFLPVLFCHRPQ